MDLRTATTREPDPDAVEFIRFCYHRRRVGWPELYDEMCAVAARGLFRGLVADDLAAYGIGFSLFDMPALAALSTRIVVEEQAARRPMTVVIEPVADDVIDAPATTPAIVQPVVDVVIRSPVEPSRGSEPAVRYAVVTAGA